MVGVRHMIDFTKLDRSLGRVHAARSGLCSPDVPQAVSLVHVAAAAVAYCHSGRLSPLDPASEPVLGDDRIGHVHQVVREAEEAPWGPTTGILPQTARPL